jgi:hypothetical protein
MKLKYHALVCQFLGLTPIPSSIREFYCIAGLVERMNKRIEGVEPPWPHAITASQIGEPESSVPARRDTYFFTLVSSSFAGKVSSSNPLK